ncbi:hypothetical protein FB451DRAFT_1233036 [Mycena latifolia]|nr:hypothetical protein FB451DRAFT_1233036 [Mycena latifolia]
MAVPLGGTGLSYAESAFLSLFLEALFYGLFVFMYAISTFVVCRRRTSGQTSLGNVNIPLLAVSSSMFIFGTIHLGIDAHRAMESFVYYPGGAFAYLLATGTNSGEYVLKNVLYNVQTLLGDGFIIYRLYQTWGRNKFIAFPFFLCFLASIATAIGVNVTQTLRKPNQSIFSGALHDWPLAFFIMTFIVNVGCTSLIAYRIWAVNRQTKMLNVGTLVPVAVVIVESGLIYSIAVVIDLALYLSNSGAYKIVQDTLMQIIGLVFCGIIASMGLGLSNSTKDDPAAGRSTKASALVFHAQSSGSEAETSRIDHPDPLELVDVEKGRVSSQ